MPKKKGKSGRKVIIGIILVAVVAVAIIGWHDGLVGVTPIEDIHAGNLVDGWDIADGTAVTVKGTITAINTLLNWVTINDGTGSIGFTWGFADDLEVDSVVVVRGVVNTELVILRFIDEVTSVQVVWLFA